MLTLCRKISISALKIWWEVTFLYIETAFVNNMETMRFIVSTSYYFTVTICGKIKSFIDGRLQYKQEKT